MASRDSTASVQSALYHASAELWCFVAILGVHASLLTWMAVMDSPTCDEPFHLAAGVRHLQSAQFDLDRGNPPVSGTLAALPVMLFDVATEWRGVPDCFNVGRDFIDVNGVASLWYVTVGRWACIPLSLLGCGVGFLWARDLYGTRAGLMCSLLWCFCPNLLAHGHLVTGDMAATTFFLAASYSFWRWLEAPSIQRSLLAGLTLGLAELSKYVCLLLYPLGLLIWLIARLARWRDFTRKRMLGDMAHLGYMGALSVSLINVAYLGEGSFSRLDRYRIGRQLVGALSSSTALPAEQGAVSPKHRLGSFPVPLPEDYVLGIDEIQTWYKNQASESYLRGAWRDGGWWYYYVYGLFVKTPIGTLLLLMLSVAASVLVPACWAGWRNEAALLVPVIAMFAFVTTTTTIQSHVRYVLPVVPFLYIWASKTVHLEAIRRLRLNAVMMCCLTASIVSSLSVFPHCLSYFNELVGGPLQGRTQLIDSNLDWGQDLLYLNKWLARNTGARPMHVAHQGLVNPVAVGMPYPAVPARRGYSGEDLGIPAEDLGPQPGWHAVCVQQMYLKRLDYFQDFEPVAYAGYSFFIFHLNCAEVNHVRDTLGIPRIECDSNGDREAAE